MLVWFIAIAAMGVSGILRHPKVFSALNPVYGLSYLVSHGATGFLVLGAVFLCVTGAECSATIRMRIRIAASKIVAEGRFVASFNMLPLAVVLLEASRSRSALHNAL